MYLLGFEVDNFGKVYTQSNLQNYMDGTDLTLEKILNLPNPTGKIYKYATAYDDMPFDITAIAEKNNWDTYETLKDILENDNIPSAIFCQNSEFGNKIVRLLNIHNRTELEGDRRSASLKNMVAQKMREVCMDASTQVDALLPIDMSESKTAADKNDSNAKYMSWNASTMKFDLQKQNMVGRNVIGSVAVSLKSYFAGLTAFQERIHDLTNRIRRDPNFFTEEKVTNFVNDLLDITYIDSSGNIATLTNVDFSELKQVLLNKIEGNIDALIKINYIDNQSSTFEHVNKNYTIENESGKYINLYKLIDDIDNASNKEKLVFEDGKYRWTGLDAAMSLSGLLSAATDNAKELILSKLNATSEFSDIYTAALTTGMSFKEISDIMTSKAFNIVARFSKTNIFDKNSYGFNVRNAIDFVLDRGVLKNFDRTTLTRVLTSKDIIDVIFEDKGEPLVDFSGLFPNVDNEEIYERIINKEDNNGYSAKGVVDTILKALWGENGRTLESAILSKVAELAFNSKQNVSLSEAEMQERFEAEMEAAEAQAEAEQDAVNFMDDDNFQVSFSKNYNFRKLSYDDYASLYKYLKYYLNPKNQLIRAIGKDADKELSKLNKITNILDIADELKMQGRLCSINQGVKNNNQDEANWVNDINRFVNKRYYNSKIDYTYEPFDIIRFTSGDEEYRNKQISQYEKVKSAINILKSVTNAKHFNSMLKFVNLNRSIVERATSVKLARKLYDEVLMRSNQDGESKRGISYWRTLKLSPKALKTISNFSRDTLIINWLKSLDKSKIEFYVPEGEVIYNERMGQDVCEGDMADNPMSLSTDNGMLTFKRLMDRYIIPKLKEKLGIDKDGNVNEFINRMCLNVVQDFDTKRIKTYSSLNIRTTHIDEDAAALKIYDKMVKDFKAIMNITTDELGLNIGHWSLKDLFFMYNLLQNKDGFGKNSYTRIFEDLVNSGKAVDLVNNYYNWLADLDSNTDDSKFDNINYNIKNLRFLIAWKNPNDAFKVNATTGKEDNNQPFVQLDQSKYYPYSNLAEDDLFGFIANYFGNIQDNVQGVKESKLVNAPSISTTPTEIMNIFREHFSGVTAGVKFYSDRFSESEDGYVSSDGNIYINERFKDRFGDVARVMLHEYMHVICAKLRNSSNTRFGYYNLVNRIGELLRGKTNSDLEIAAQNLARPYINKGVYGTALNEEVLIKLLENAFVNSSTYSKLNNLSPETANLQDEVKKAIKEIFNLKNKDYENTSLPSIMKTDLQTLLNVFVSGVKDTNRDDNIPNLMMANSKLAGIKKAILKHIKEYDVNFVGC